MNQIRLRWKIKRKTWWRDKTATERGDFYLRSSLIISALLLVLLLGASLFFANWMIAIIGMPIVLMVLFLILLVGS